MKCPVCKEVTLNMSERQGVDIDYCPQCRGVWLDRGELEKLIERSERQRPMKSVSPADYQYSGEARRDHGRRKSWLAEIFD
ncbi:MAG: zf-TFIIB domain-containing protein [Burkholderiales bacterium]|nr:zf-TFIIB domain-containing protein [Burkholderiales bacterium]